MGVYLNPEPKRFAESTASEIFVDKSRMISYTNSVIDTEQKYICVSRPRRFGKSMAVGMLSAYYGNGETRDLFKGLNISNDPFFDEYRNRYQVISVNIQEFLSRSKNVEDMITLLQRKLTSYKKIWFTFGT